MFRCYFYDKADRQGINNKQTFVVYFLSRQESRIFLKMTFVPWSKSAKEKSPKMENTKSAKTCKLSKKTIWITISVFGFILIQSLILGFWFMTYTTLNQERIKVSELEGRLAKMANYEALLKYNEDADKKLYKVKAMAKGQCYQLFDMFHGTSRSLKVPKGV